MGVPLYPSLIGLAFFIFVFLLSPWVAHWTAGIEESKEQKLKDKRDIENKKIREEWEEQMNNPEYEKIELQYSDYLDKDNILLKIPRLLCPVTVIRKGCYYRCQYNRYEWSYLTDFVKYPSREEGLRGCMEVCIAAVSKGGL